MTRETKHKTKCIPLRKFMEEYFQLECESCREVIKQIVVVLGLNEDSLVLPITVQCCALAEGGTCSIPLPCPNTPIIEVIHSVDYDVLEKKWVEEFCVHELISDSMACIKREAGPNPKREIEFVNSPEKATELLKRFGLDEDIARELVSRVV